MFFFLKSSKFCDFWSLDDAKASEMSRFSVLGRPVQEIVEIYPYLTSNANAADLTPNASNRVCNSLALLQCLLAAGLILSDG